MPVTVELEELPGEYAVSRLPTGSPVPDWVTGEGLVNVTYAEDELSVLCLAARVPDGVETASGWAAIKVSDKFGFDEPGVVLSVVQPLSSKGLGVFVTSTFYRDYLLVRQAELATAKLFLREAGHHFLTSEAEAPPLMAPDIRAATPKDAAEIATFHVKVWRQVYEGIAPEDVVAQLDEAHRRRYWLTSLAAKSQKALIALQGDQIVGLVSFGAARDPALGQGGEIKHLYVEPDCAGQGLGRRLMALAFEELAAAGFDQAALAVVEANDAARRFYARLGGIEGAQFTDPGPLWKSANVAIFWPLERAE